MTRPILATPTLRGREAIKFIERMHKNSNKPVGLIPTPKLDKARELIKQYRETKKD